MNVIENDKIKKNVIAILDARFQNVSSYIELKLFLYYSKMTQWTRKKSKNILRQLLIVFAFFLAKKHIDKLHVNKIIVNFIMLAKYRSHDEQIVKYIKATLYKIDLFKKIFRNNRFENKTKNQNYFNFFKWHIMKHYSHFIRR